MRTTWGRRAFGPSAPSAWTRAASSSIRTSFVSSSPFTSKFNNNSPSPQVPIASSEPAKKEEKEVEITEENPDFTDEFCCSVHFYDS